jgi:sugar-specific transcriptional regulator TrmB
MTQNQESIQTLMNLGLTQLEAKVYLTLLMFGNGGVDVKRIAKESNTARQYVYRILPSLQQFGLVVRIVATPSIYQATSLKNGLSMLLKQKTEEHNALKNKIKKLFIESTINNVKASVENDAPQFAIISEKKLFFKTVENEILRGQRVINIVCSNDGMQAIAFNLVKDFQKSIARNVKIRLITSNTENHQILERLQPLIRSPGFEIKFISNVSPVVGLAIFDSRKVCVRISSELVPSLWTNNPNVIKLAEAYFEGMWVKGNQAKMMMVQIASELAVE